MDHQTCPSLYQLNTRVHLSELGRALGRRATIDDIADRELDRLADQGFDWLWLLSVWQTGVASRQVSRTHAELRAEFLALLPDLQEEDIEGSGFAITGYAVHPSLGGDEALARLRERLRLRGIRLMLDFVPNHTALDHPWAEAHLEYYVAGSELDLTRFPHNYTRRVDAVLAHGRDPYFPGWTDTLQLNYANPAAQAALLLELVGVAERCDGVRCDMAMLVLPEVFERTWGLRAGPFWPAAIAEVRRRFPAFTMMAEVYWDLEWTMQQQGFDYTYDKRLYDRLRDGRAGPVRDHFGAGLEYQSRMARFLENHDEPRAAVAFPRDVHEAAAILTYLTPGLRFFHEGQLVGRRKKISPHVIRAPVETADAGLEAFYDRLIGVLQRPEVRAGQWELLDLLPAWDGNWTQDCFIAFSWQLADANPLVVVVNFAPNQSQCYVRLPIPGLPGRSWQLRDLTGPDVYQRDGDDLAARGLYLDLTPWQYHVFEGIPA